MLKIDSGHDLRYVVDSSKIHNELGWNTKKSFEDGLELTIKWYIDNESWWREIQNNKYDQERLGLKKLKVKVLYETYFT